MPRDDCRRRPSPLSAGARWPAAPGAAACHRFRGGLRRLVGRDGCSSGGCRWRCSRFTRQRGVVPSSPTGTTSPAAVRRRLARQGEHVAPVRPARRLAGGAGGAAAVPPQSLRASFQTTYWITVVLNCAALAWLLSPYGAQTLQAVLAAIWRRGGPPDGGRPASLHASPDHPHVTERRHFPVRPGPSTTMLALYVANRWSSPKARCAAARAARDSHALATRARDGRLVGLVNAISRAPGGVFPAHTLVLPIPAPGHRAPPDGGDARALSRFPQLMLTADGDAVTFYQAMGFTRAGRTVSMWIYAGKDREGGRGVRSADGARPLAQRPLFCTLTQHPDPPDRELQSRRIAGRRSSAPPARCVPMR